MYIKRHLEKTLAVGFVRLQSRVLSPALSQQYHQARDENAELYFLDTGLAAYLTRWNTPEVLQHGAMAGAFFESFVVAEILKSYANSGVLEPPQKSSRLKNIRLPKAERICSFGLEYFLPPRPHPRNTVLTV